jgi:hypothetical protein
MTISKFLSISPSDTMAEWSKAVDLSAAWISTTEMCVGSNPTRVKSTCFCFYVLHFTFLAFFLLLKGVWMWREMLCECWNMKMKRNASSSSFSCCCLIVYVFLLFAHEAQWRGR